MSFASDMKNELTRIEVDESNAKAELSALIRMNGALSLSNQQFVMYRQKMQQQLVEYILLSNVYLMLKLKF